MKRPRTSDVWQYFDPASPELAVCRTCLAEVRTKSSNTSGLRRHIMTHSGQKRSKQSSTYCPQVIPESMLDLILDFIVDHALPINIVGSSSFKKLLQKAVETNNAPLPCRETVKLQLVNRHLQMKNEIIEVLKNTHFSFTTDSWCSDNKVLNILMVHYFENGIKTTKCIDCFSTKDTESSTLANYLTHFFNTHEITPSTMTTDASTKMIECYEELKTPFPDLSHFHCLAHDLKNALQNSYELSPSLSQLLIKTSKIIEMCKKNKSIRTELYANTTYRLKSFCPTRWHSILDQYQSLLHFSEQLDSIIMRDSNKFGCLWLTFTEKMILQDVCKIIQIVQKYIGIFSMDNLQLFEYYYHFKKLKEEIRDYNEIKLMDIDECQSNMNGEEEDEQEIKTEEEENDSDNEGEQDMLKVKEELTFDAMEVNTFMENILNYIDCIIKPEQFANYLIFNPKLAYTTILDMKDWEIIEQLFNIHDLDKCDEIESNDQEEFASLIKNCSNSYRAFIELNRNSPEFDDSLKNYNKDIYDIFCNLRTSVATSVATEAVLSVARRVNHDQDNNTFNSLICLNINSRY